MYWGMEELSSLSACKESFYFSVMFPSSTLVQIFHSSKKMQKKIWRFKFNLNVMNWLLPFKPHHWWTLYPLLSSISPISEQQNFFLNCKNLPLFSNKYFFAPTFPFLYLRFVAGQLTMKVINDKKLLGSFFLLFHLPCSKCISRKVL